MASRFWVGGTGTWDASDTTHWSATSGGAGAASVPTSVDDVTFDANSGGGTVTVSVAINVLSITSGAHTGTLNTNNQSVAASTFSPSGSGVRTLTLGSSSITLTGSASAWGAATTTNLTVTANTATATLNGAGGQFTGGSFNWNGLSVVLSGSGTQPVQAGTLKNLTRTGTAVKTDVLSFQGAVTVTGAFTVTGNSTTTRVLVQSSVPGTTRTITVNTTVAVSNADFSDITGAGTASWNLSAATGGSGDAGGNTGITFTTATTRFAVAAGNWSSTATWSATSGGAGGASVPLPQDAVVLNASSAAGTYTADMPRLGKDIDFTGFTRTWTISLSSSLFGSLTLASGMTFSGALTITFAGRGTHTVTSAGKSFGTNNATLSGPGGTYTLNDALTSGNTLNVSDGTLLCNGFAVTATNFASTTARTRAITMGSGAWTLGAAAGIVWQTSSTGLTLTVTGNTTSFTSTSGTPTITTGSVSMPNFTFNGVGGSWTLNDAFTAAGTITLTNGTLNTNGQSVTAGSFSSSNSNVRTLTMGSSSITLSVSWTATVTNLTVTTNTTTLTLTGNITGVVFTGSMNWNGLSVVITGSGLTAINPGTLANLTRTGTAVKTDGLNVQGSFTVTGTFTVTGNSASNRLLVQSNTIGTTRTITAGATSLTNTDFSDITAAGAAAWTGTSLGDALGNSGITLDAPTTQTHTASAGGNWSDGTKWTSRVPLPQDAVIIDANTTGTVTADMPRLGKDITFTGFAGTWTWTTSPTIYGSLTLAAGLSFTATAQVTFAGRGSHTLTSAGRTFLAGITISALTGTYAMADALADNRAQLTAVTVATGTFDTNGNSLSLSGVGINGFTMNGGSVVLRSSAVTFAAASATTVWSVTGGSVSAGTSTMTLTSASTLTRTFAGGGQTYGTLRYDVAASTGALVVTGANTFASLIVGDGRTLTLPSSTTTTVTSALTLTGTTLSSSTAGTAATISAAAGVTVTATGVSLQDSTATGGALFQADAATSTRGTNVTGWSLLTAASLGGSVTPASTIVPMPSRALAGSASSSSAVTRAATRAVTGAATPVGAAARLVPIALAATLSSLGALDAQPQLQLEGSTLGATSWTPRTPDDCPAFTGTTFVDMGEVNAGTNVSEWLITGDGTDASFLVLFVTMPGNEPSCENSYGNDFFFLSRWFGPGDSDSIPNGLLTLSTPEGAHLYVGEWGPNFLQSDPLPDFAPEATVAAFWPQVGKLAHLQVNRVFDATTGPWPRRLSDDCSSWNGTTIVDLGPVAAGTDVSGWFPSSGGTGTGEVDLIVQNPAYPPACFEDTGAFGYLRVFWSTWYQGTQSVSGGPWPQATSVPAGMHLYLIEWGPNSLQSDPVPIVPPEAFVADFWPSMRRGGDLTRNVARKLNGVEAAVGGLARQVDRLLSGATASSGHLSRQDIVLLRGALDSLGELELILTRTLHGAVAPSGHDTRHKATALSGSTSTVGVLTRQSELLLAGTLDPSGAVTQLRVRILVLRTLIGGLLTAQLDGGHVKRHLDVGGAASIKERQT